MPKDVHIEKKQDSGGITVTKAPVVGGLNVLSYAAVFAHRHGLVVRDRLSLER